MKKTLSILAILLIPLILTFFSGCSPIAKTITALKPQPENPVFAEWTSMRARHTEQGTNVHWRLCVWLVFPDHFIARLEDNLDYPVFCSPYSAPSYAFKVAEGDWVEVEGLYLGVTSHGEVKIGLWQLTNLGPKD